MFHRKHETAEISPVLIPTSRDRDDVKRPGLMRIPPVTASCFVPGSHALRYRLLFWAIVLASALLWVLLPAAVQPGYQFDNIESLFTAKEWTLSTLKHPAPCCAWVLEIVNLATGRSFAAPFIASQLWTLLSLWAIRQCARLFLSERLALFVVLSMLPYKFFASIGVEYNHNIPLIALWTLAIYFAFRASRDNRLRYWILTGIVLGLGFHAKYSIVFLVFSILVSTVFDARARACWKTPGPYWTTAVAFLIALPQLVWLCEHEFMPFFYAWEGRGGAVPPWDHLRRPLNFCADQALFLVGPCLILLPFLGFRWKRRRETPPGAEGAERFLFVTIMLPFVLHLLIVAVTGARMNAHYGAPFWPLFTVWLLVRYESTDGKTARTASTALFFLVEAGQILALLFTVLLLPYINREAQPLHYPMRELGAVCDEMWSRRDEGPCPYVTGDWLVAGYAAIAMKDRPTVHFYYGNSFYRPGTIPSATWSADADVNERGGLAIWITGHQNTAPLTRPPGFVLTRFPKAEMIPDTICLPYKTGAELEPLKVRAAYIPPAKKPGGIARE